jgi:acetolactate synthase-1/2/3 large subunit
MGFGLPAAIGAKVAAPQKTVIDIDGDASFSMTAMELSTAAQFGIGVKVLVLNNEFQGMVQQWQDLFYDQRYSHTRMTNPDFVLLARSMGVHAIRCETAEQLPEKMKEFLEYDGSKPVLLECIVEKNEHVFPMVGSDSLPRFFVFTIRRSLRVRRYTNSYCILRCEKSEGHENDR